jgi:hypothetical protein
MNALLTGSGEANTRSLSLLQDFGILPIGQLRAPQVCFLSCRVSIVRNHLLESPMDRLRPSTSLARQVESLQILLNVLSQFTPEDPKL